MTARVAVLGASGYIGGELLRILLGHPKVEVAAYSFRLAGRHVGTPHPNLRAITDLTFRPPEDLDGCATVLLALPPGASMSRVAELLDRATCVIDLGVDFRLRDPREYERRYGRPHALPEVLDTFVPGWPERHRADITKADRISVPGCMATAAVLALYPLAAADLIGGEVLIDGRVGSSGGGAHTRSLNVHAERSGTLRLFATTGHRHEAEITQALGATVRMYATGVPTVRGAQVICHARLRRPMTEVELRHLYRSHYETEPFVRVITQRRGGYRMPEPKVLTGSNYCDVGFARSSDGTAVMAVGALDNLVKGGAGNAVQCMNIRMGWPERLGLEFPGLHPV